MTVSTALAPVRKKQRQTRRSRVPAAPVVRIPTAKAERRPQPARKSQATQPARQRSAKPAIQKAKIRDFPIGLLFCLGLSIVLAAYRFRAATGLHAETGMGYALGIASVVCILGLLLYPVRKRIRWLTALGPVSTWFQLHMMLGVFAATLAVLHSNFSLGSSNSRFAFGAVLLVAGSGLVGRYLYRKARSNLSIHRAEIRAMRVRMQNDQPKRNSRLRFVRLLQERLDRFDVKTLEEGSDVWQSMRQRMSLHTRIAREHGALLRFASRQLRREARTNRVLQRHQLHLHHAIEGYLNSHMLQVEKLARLLFWERLFRLWHLIHLPVFGLLVISVSVHVAAVHLY